MHPPSPRLPYQPALDGLRALAVLAVLLFHSELGVLPGGYLGVSTFFTLSGFLIGSLLLREQDATGRLVLGAFWIRRLRRLMPAAFLGIALATLVTVAGSTVEGLARLRGDGFSALLYYSNWHFWWSGQPYSDLFVRPSAFQHFWSLSIEEQFYVLLPLLMVVAHLGTRRWPLIRPAVVVVALSLTLALQWVLAAGGADPSRLYYGTDTRAPELLVGVLLAWWLREDAGGSGFRRVGSPVLLGGLGGLGLLTSLGCWLALDEPSPIFASGALLAYSLSSAAILWASVSPTWVARGLGLAPLVWIGRISYGLYVYHWPIFRWIELGPGAKNQALEAALELSLTFACAWVSYRLIEYPVRRGRLGRGRVGAAMAVTGLVATSVLLLQSPSPLTAVATQYTRTLEPMRIGRPSADGLRIVVVGDSLAVSLFFGFERWVDPQGDLRVVVSGRQCPLALAARRRAPHGPVASREQCGPWVAGLPQLIAEERPDRVVVLDGFWEIQDAAFSSSAPFESPGSGAYDAWMIDELTRRVDELTASGQRIVWLTAPCPGRSQMQPPLQRFAALSSTRFRYYNDVILARVQARRPAKMRILDLDARVCPGGVFSLAVGDVAVGRPDGLHFSPEAAEWVSRWLVDQLRRMR